MSTSLNNTQWLDAFYHWVRIQQFRDSRDFADFLSSWSSFGGKFPESLIDRYCPRRRSDAERLGRSQWSIKQLVSFLKLYLHVRSSIPGKTEGERLEWFLQNRGEAFLAGEVSVDAAASTVDQVVSVGDVVRIRPLDEELGVVVDVRGELYVVETYFGERMYVSRADLVPEPSASPFESPPSATHTFYLSQEQAQAFDRALRGKALGDEEVGHSTILSRSDSAGTVSITLAVVGGPDSNRVVAVVTVQRDGQERLYGPKFNARRTVFGRYVCEGGPVVLVEPETG